MNKADELPLCYKRCLARDHQVEEGAVPVRGVNRLWVMPRDDVISRRRRIASRSPRAAKKNWKSADTDVARRDAGRVPRRAKVPRAKPARRSSLVTAASALVVKESQAPPSSLAKLTMYSRRTRPERGTSISPPGKRRWARPLETWMSAAHATSRSITLAEKNGTAVTELRYESPELVTGTLHFGERLASLGHPVARGEPPHPPGAASFPGIRA